MAGDYLIYFKHTTVFEGNDKGTYYEPCLYTISSGDTILLNPKTGEISKSLTYDDKKTSISSPFTDGKRVGWGYLKSETDSEIILLEPLTGDITIKTTEGSNSGIRLDGNRIVWQCRTSLHSTVHWYMQKRVSRMKQVLPGGLQDFHFLHLLRHF
ncbi:MAG: hypothetical protein JW931_02060 [Methanomicrobiaceae archaeon]|nr:hypothetical protein [Methanomicrobiaceae archaeon]